MTASKYLTSLKLPQLRHAAFLLGLPTSGKKSDICQSITSLLKAPSPITGSGRIASIDMGIRNLGICVLEAPHLVTPPNSGSSIQDSPLRITAWRRLDITSRLGSRESTADIAGAQETGDASKKSLITTGAFAPSSLSQAAYSVTEEILSTYKPDSILIERQRFRSGGNSAVLEWTLRVNMLESMIWACLRTMRAQNECHVAKGYEVSPAKVARFWCGGLSRDVSSLEDLEAGGQKGLVAKDAGRNKITKADKIAVVQRWLDGEVGDGEAGDEEVQLEFLGAALEMKKAFLSSLSGQKGRKKKRGDVTESDGAETGKLDDLADCLLQAVAWVKWEENRREFGEIVGRG